MDTSETIMEIAERIAAEVADAEQIGGHLTADGVKIGEMADGSRRYYGSATFYFDLDGSEIDLTYRAPAPVGAPAWANIEWERTVVGRGAGSANRAGILTGGAVRRHATI